MAAKKIEKGSGEWNLFMDYWAIYQKYFDPEENDEYWESLRDDLDGFWKKYQGQAGSFPRGLANVLNQHMKEKMEANGGGK